MPTEYILPTYVSFSHKAYSTSAVITARLADIHRHEEWRHEADDANRRIQRQREKWFLGDKTAKSFTAGDLVLWYPKEAKI